MSIYSWDCDFYAFFKEIEKSEECGFVGYEDVAYIEGVVVPKEFVNVIILFSESFFKDWEKGIHRKWCMHCL